MNTKRQKLGLLAAMMVIICSGYGFQPAQDIPAIIAVDMEGDVKSNACKLVGKDSITEGIHGSAKYFSNTTIKIDQKELLFPLWENHDFSVVVWVKTVANNDEYQVIASNKDWNSGEVKDFTTNRYFGFSRTSGNNTGWAIVCQPDGSWAWNIGDGKYRLDYRTTSPRQQINEGEWHQMAFTINRRSKEAHMYFDGLNVAIYNIGEMRNLNSGLPVNLGSDALAHVDAPSFEGALDEFNIYDYVLSADDIAREYKQYAPASKLPPIPTRRVDKLNLMTWNIWHGGRRHGREIGPQQVIGFIKDTGADIIMMQETYGSGALIADALDYYFYWASDNLSVMSKYPIVNTWTVYDALRCGVATIRLSKEQTINVSSLWIHYLPAWRRDSRASDATAEKLLAGEDETRHKEIKEIVRLLDKQIQEADDIPLIIGGDFNSPSHKGWVDETKDWHNGLVVAWPVSKLMQKTGFKDSFREIRPDLHYASPTMTAEKLSYRIDYIYYKGRNLKALDSNMHFKHKGAWPSDHPAVTTTIAIK